MAELLEGPPNALAPPGSALSVAMEALDNAAAPMIARTLAWSAINSGSRELKNLSRMRDVFADAFSTLPGKLEIIELAPAEIVQPGGDVTFAAHGDSLRVSVRPEAPIQIALTGHYDTVFPAAHAFQSPKRDGNILHGPGCADMKGGLSVMLAALQAFEAIPGEKRVGYTVLINPDEEIGSQGSAPLLAELGARAHVGMTYEPALPDGAMVSARKGSGNFSLSIKGRAAHVGRAFHEGRSAIEAAAEAALALLALNGQHAETTLNVGAIDGGSPVNQVPDRAIVRFNVRAPDAEARQWIEEKIAAIAEKASARPGIEAHIHGGFTRPPKPLSPQLQRLIEWTQAAGRLIGADLSFAPTGGVCEGNNLAAAGCWNIDTLGVRGGDIHTDREFALADSFAERAKLSLILLAGFESGVFDARGLRS
ncbi:MAG: hydrolase [Caulobacterales bacterium]